MSRASHSTFDLASVDHLFDVSACKERAEGRHVVDFDGVDDVEALWRGELDEADPFRVAVIAVGLGVEGDDGLAEGGLDGARQPVTVGDKLEGGAAGYHATGGEGEE